MSAVEQAPMRCAGCDGQFATNLLVTLKGRLYCAACKENALDDLKAGVSSTGIEMAGLGARFAAQFIDGLILGVPVMVGAVALGFFAVKAGHEPGIGSQIIQQFLFTIPYLLYAGLMLTATGGQTLGKKVMKLWVVRVDGAPADGGNFWKRELGRWLFALLPLLGLIDYLMAFNKQRRTLHDKVGGTIVVRVG